MKKTLLLKKFDNGTKVFIDGEELSKVTQLAVRIHVDGIEAIIEQFGVRYRYELTGWPVMEPG